MLTVVQMLREKGVVGKFVEFFGEGLAGLPLADRATIANMAPEYGATCGIFPIDSECLRYLELSGRSTGQVALVEAYARAQGLFMEADAAPARYSDLLHLDMNEVVPSIAGPRRPQDRIALTQAKDTVDRELRRYREERAERHSEASGEVSVEQDGAHFSLSDGAVVIAAITSCTNTSNPAVMVGAGLLARNARARGLRVPPLGKDEPRPRLAGGHGIPAQGRIDGRTSRRSASTSSAMGAPPASETRDRCLPRSARQ